MPHGRGDRPDARARPMPTRMTTTTTPKIETGSVASSTRAVSQCCGAGRTRVRSCGGARTFCGSDAEACLRTGCVVFACALPLVPRQLGDDLRPRLRHPPTCRAREARFAPVEGAPGRPATRARAPAGSTVRFRGRAGAAPALRPLIALLRPSRLGADCYEVRVLHLRGGRGLAVARAAADCSLGVCRVRTVISQRDPARYGMQVVSAAGLMLVGVLDTIAGFLGRPLMGWLGAALTIVAAVYLVVAIRRYRRERARTD